MGSDARHQPIAGKQSDALQSYPLRERQEDAIPQKTCVGESSGQTPQDRQTETLSDRQCETA